MLFGLICFSFLLVLFSNRLRGSLENLVPTEAEYMAGIVKEEFYKTIIFNLL